MRAIYEPKGRAREYAPLAANLYRGCAHQCRYCYGPACLRMSREEFAKAKPRPGVLAALEREAPKYRGEGPVLLCFSCDPYQPIEADLKITRRAIEILGEAGVKIRVLTKGGRLAMRDFDLFEKYGVEFGQTIVFADDKLRQDWEPGAATIREREIALETARAHGIRRWISVEPVIDPDQALTVINDWAGLVDTWKIGKLNYHSWIEKGIDWLRFLDAALCILADCGAGWYIKDDLWAYANAAIREKYSKTRDPKRSLRCG